MSSCPLHSPSLARPPPEADRRLTLRSPPNRCRTCSSGSAFKAWTSQAKTLKAGVVPGVIAGAAATTTTKTPTPPAPRADCPPDVEELGRSTWTLLHSIAATYPRAPTAREQGDLRTFVGVFGRLYPCWVCAEDFRSHVAAAPPPVGSRDEFGRWLCQAHNAVNEKLGKPRFDCDRWEERWGTGWKDGSCD